jgi:hypothetical protein
LPNATDAAQFDQGDWEKLFNAFQAAFRSMDAAKSGFKDNKNATDFLNEYFGHDSLTGRPRLFTLAVSTPDLDQDINRIAPLLTTHRSSLSKWLKANGNFFENEAEYDEFVRGLTATPRKYNTDAKFQKKLKGVADYLGYGLREGSFERDAALTTALTGVSGSLDNVEKGFDASAAANPAKLEYFKRNYNSLLRTLYKDKKVFEVFKDHDSGKISKPLAKAIEKTDYNNKDSKDYVPPKRPDEITLGQQISDWWGNTYEDCLEKYAKLKGDRLFFSPEAKFITKAIDGAKIKPTDGLATVLDKAKDIQANLMYKSPKAAEAFEYFTTIMGELKTTMKHAFAGALSNARQMRALVEEMVLSAVPNKIKEAKIAMEILTVIRYGYTTSKIMDTINKEPLSIFGDKSLSWNKNSGIQFVTKALDTSIKGALMGVGYGITMVGNAINLSGAKFNGKGGRLQGARKELRDQNNDDKIKVQDARDQDRAQITDINNTVSRNGTISEAAVEASKTTIEQDIATLRQDLAQHNSDKNQANADITGLENEIRDLETKRDQMEQPVKEIQNLKRELRAMRKEIAADRAALAGMAEPDLGIQKNVIAAKEIEADKKQKEFDTKSKNVASIISTWQKARSDKLVKDAEKTRRRNDSNAAQGRIDSVDRQLRRQQAKLRSRDNRLHQFQEARGTIGMLTDQIAKRDDTLRKWDDNHKDQYLQLMAHWDFLNTSSNVKSWSLGRKSVKQKYLDSKINVGGEMVPRREDMLKRHLDLYEQQYAA